MIYDIGICICPRIHHLYWHIRCIQDLQWSNIYLHNSNEVMISRESVWNIIVSHVPTIFSRSFSTRLLTCYVIKTKSCARWWMAIHLDTRMFFLILVLLMIVSCWVLKGLTFRTLTPWWVEVEFRGYIQSWVLNVPLCWCTMWNFMN